MVYRYIFAVLAGVFAGVFYGINLTFSRSEALNNRARMMRLDGVQSATSVLCREDAKRRAIIVI